jgi:hypothetical protein
MPIEKIIVPTIKNGKEECDLPVIAQLDFFDKSQNIIFSLETTEKGGTYDIKEPFEYFGCEGKLWALDRQKGSGHYFKLYNSGINTTESKILNIKIRLSGPFATFSLFVEAIL